MIFAPEEMSWETLAQLVAISYGQPISKEFAGYVVWNHTGFPSFWPAGMTPVQGGISQLRDFFAGDKELQTV